MIEKKHVAIIGGGAAGIAAAEELSGHGLSVAVVEKSPFVGGHAARLSCKAAEACVKCGACMVQDRLTRLAGRPNVHLMTDTHIVAADQKDRFVLGYHARPALVDPTCCDGCGDCLAECPQEGALARSHTPGFGAPVTVNSTLCRYIIDQSCTQCRDVCSRDAIDLDAKERSGQLMADAVLIATGFTPCNPKEKPYGYGRFPDVVTNLDAERILRSHGSLVRPSNGKEPDRIAFIQCVGSRDNRMGHPWCSKICCGSALRTAGLVLHQRPETSISFFYIDVQTFGKDFHTYYDHIRQKVRLVRAVPGGIVAAESGRLNISYFDSGSNRSIEEAYDMAILSVGISPPEANQHMAVLFGIGVDENGFLQSHPSPPGEMPAGVYTAGAALEPMSIADSIESAGKAAWDVIQYLESRSACA